MGNLRVNGYGGRRMMRRSTLCYLASLSVMWVGCGTTNILMPQPSVCLAVDDVLNIPPGDGTQTMVLGTYHAITQFRESCAQCSKNTFPETECTDDTIDVSVRTTFTQDGGILTVERTDGNTLQGGINTDGTFIIGATVTPTRDDGVQSGQGLVLFEGRFTGNVIIATITVRLTVNDPGGGVLDAQSVHAVTLERVE